MAIIIIITALSIALGIFSIKFLGDDNIVEEVCEEVIKDSTGVDADLSPKSSETKKVKKRKSRRVMRNEN
jgi:hypothetical protein